MDLLCPFIPMVYGGSSRNSDDSQEVAARQAADEGITRGLSLDYLVSVCLKWISLLVLRFSPVMRAGVETKTTWHK